MDQATIERIESSFNEAKPHAVDLVERFYELLFERHAQLRALFPADMSEQRKKLAATLGVAVGMLRSPEKLRPVLLDLGRKHIGYGAKPEHYAAVRDALVDALGETAGAAWTNQLDADWRELLDHVSQVMLEGATGSKQAA